MNNQKNMTIDEMQARRDEIDQEILDHRKAIEELKSEFNRLGDRMEGIRIDELDEITGGRKM